MDNRKRQGTRASGKGRNKRAICTPAGTCIYELSAEVVPFFDHAKEALEYLGIWLDIDALLLLRYAEYAAEWVKLSGDVRKNGSYEQATNKNGRLYQAKRPQFARLIFVESSLQRLEKELGLSRKSRRGILAAPSPEDEDPHFFKPRG